MNEGKDRQECVANALIEYQTALYAFLYVQIGDSETARDLLQETNLVILRNSSRLDALENFKPWAKTVAAFQLKKWRTLREREGRVVLFDGPCAEMLAEQLAGDAPQSQETDISVRALSFCLKKLPPDALELIRRRYWRKESIASIARALGKSQGSLAVRFLRVRSQLRDCVKNNVCSWDKEDADEAAALALEKILEGGAFAGTLPQNWIEQAAMHAALLYNAHSFAIENTPLRNRKRLGKILAWAALFLAFFSFGAAFLLKTPRKNTEVKEEPVGNPFPGTVNEQEEPTEMKATTTAATIAAAALAVSPPLTVSASESHSSIAGAKGNIVTLSGASMGDSGGIIEARAKVSKSSAQNKIDTQSPRGTVVILI